jgi:hypothetical protein
MALLPVVLASSLLPVMLLIHQHGGGWLGQALETGGRPNPSPPVGIVVNSMNLLLGNFQPPLFPLADWWNAHAYHWLPHGLFEEMVRTFEPGAAHLALMDLQFEVFAGLGMCVSLLLLISWLTGRYVAFWSWVWRQCVEDPAPRTAITHARLVRWSVVVSVGAFMVAMNVGSPGRLFTPYYCLLIPLFLAGGSGELELVRCRWWRSLAGLAFAVTAVMLVLNPPRPLFPAKAIFSSLGARYPQSSMLSRAALLYQSYAVRWDLLAGVREHIPPSEKDVALATYISGSPMQTSLWRPFGHRRIWPMRPEQSVEELKRKGIRYFVIAVDQYHPSREAWFKDWVRTNDARIVAEVPVRTLATGEQWPWYVVALP